MYAQCYMQIEKRNIKAVIKAIIKFLLLVLITFLGSVIWWNLWMYKGFIGPPQILHQLFSADGEASYDLVLIEMQIILFIVMCSAWLVWHITSQPKGQPRPADFR